MNGLTTLFVTCSLALILLVGCGSGDPTATGPDCASSEWLSSTAYQSFFDVQAAMDCYPMEVSGRQGASELEYQGVFAPFSNGAFQWRSVHGRLQADYEQRDATNQSLGFQRSWLQSFTALDGIVRFQATWTNP